MPPFSPPLDEHGFPIPATFDGRPPRRTGAFLGGIWKAGLVLVFLGLLVGLLFKSDLATGAKQFIGGQLIGRAVEKHDFGDIPGALADLDRAASWSPDDPRIVPYRARWKMEANDFAGSLEDFDRLIQKNPKDADVYLLRSQVYQRLDRHREAIDDLTKAIALSSDPTPRNNRAYARAIANIELNEALVDVEQALKRVDEELAAIRANGTDTSPTTKLQITKTKAQKAAYLDTRGYIYFQQGNWEPALEDLNEAIEATLEWQNLVMAIAKARHRPALQEQFNHELAVMYHHRGQVLAELGREDEAKSDLDHGDRLGYNPATGVF
jgi:tetratricopeptide (TPR) repeat protein